MSSKTHSPHARAEGFAARLGIRLPILLAPIAKLARNQSAGTITQQLWEDASRLLRPEV